MADKRSPAKSPARSVRPRSPSRKAMEAAASQPAPRSPDRRQRAPSVKRVAVQHEEDRERLRRSSDVSDHEPYLGSKPWTNQQNTEFFSRPHTVSALVIGLVCLIALGLSNDDETKSELNKERGVGVAAAFLIFFCSIQLRDGPFTRPHPVFWRAVTGCSLVYVLGLIYIFFQNLDDARRLMQHLDHTLGTAPGERSYGENCALYTPEDPVSMFRNVRDTINDEFVVAHLLGWWAKALLLRDYRLAWVLSIGFELLEVTLRHQLPNFYECWWDHVLLDVLICNALGIYFGLRTLKWLEMREYNWSGVRLKSRTQRRGSSTVQAVYSLVDSVVLPEHWTVYKWDVFENWKRFRNIMFVMLGILLSEVAGFYLKFILWIPPPNFLNISRLILWWLCGLDAVRVLYMNATEATAGRIDTQAWIILAMLAMEYLVIFKFSRGMFPTPMPSWIFWSWVVGGTLFMLWVSTMFRRKAAAAAAAAAAKGK